MTRRRRVGAALVVFALTCNGCMSFRGPEDLKQTISRARGIELEDEMGVRVNALGMLATAFFTNFALPVWHLSLLEVGIYEVTPADPQAVLSLRPLELADWQRSVYTREDNQESLVFVQQDESRIRAMTAVTLSGGELSIVHLQGNIDKFFENPDDTEHVLERLDTLARLLTTVGKVPRLVRRAGEVQRLHEDAIRSALGGAGWTGPAGETPAEPQEGAE